MQVPIEPETGLKVFLVSGRYRGYDVARIPVYRLNDRLIKIDKILNRLARQLVAQPIGEREVWPDLPFVLAIKVKVMPVEVQDSSNSNQIFIDGGDLRHVIDEA